MKINKKLLFFSLIFIICVYILYMEFLRPFEIGIVNYNGSLYEKDFEQNNFSLKMNIENYKYIKNINFNIKGQDIPAKVEIFFSQSYGWYDAFYYYNKTTFKGHLNINNVIKYLKNSLGEPNKTIEKRKDKNNQVRNHIKYYWQKNNQVIYIYGYTEIDQSNEISIETTVNSSIIFKIYVGLKKWLLIKIPEAWQPEWITKINPKI